MTQNEIETLVNEIRNTIQTMRKARLLTRNAIMSHIGKNNAVLRREGEKLNALGFELGDTRETRKLLIWNEYLGMELERQTGIPAEMRKSAAVTAKANGITRIKASNVNATTAFLMGKR
jgi:hypothetical protein